MQLRVMKRTVWNSEQGAHTNYVLQQLWQDAADQNLAEWRDVPVIDEKCNEAKYE